MPISYDPLAIPQFQMLTREQCEVIHRASLEILRRTEVRVYHDGALSLLRWDRQRADVWSAVI